MVLNDPGCKDVSFPDVTESLTYTVPLPTETEAPAPEKPVEVVTVSEAPIPTEIVADITTEVTTEQPVEVVSEAPITPEIVDEIITEVTEEKPVEVTTETPVEPTTTEKEPESKPSTIYHAASTVTSALDPHTKPYSHINGSAAQLLDRLAVAELCKGWPVYRDASEWANYRDLFTEDGTVWTTWSGPQHVDDFISISKAGKESGVFIMHRECGTLTELSRTHPNRAIGKMKATITHRFTFPDSQFDVDCDCRFIFFATRNPETGEWKARYVKLFYEKDKVVPVDGRTAPVFTKEELERYPVGYCYLGAAQARLGYEIDVCLPTPFNGGLYERMYGEMEKWLDGQEVDLFWEGK